MKVVENQTLVHILTNLATALKIPYTNSCAFCIRNYIYIFFNLTIIQNK